MSMMRMQYNVPEVYNSSRDFQLLERLFDLVFNGVKFDIDSIRDISDTKQISSRLLDLLQGKVGYFPKKSLVNEDDLRYVLDSFPYMIRRKGSRESIEYAVNVFFRIIGVNSSAEIKITNGKFKPTVDNSVVNIAKADKSACGTVNTKQDNTYVVEITFDADYVDTTILSDILSYILPTGYTVRYVFASEVESSDSMKTELNVEDNMNFVVVSDSIMSQVRGTEVYDNNINTIINSVGLTETCSTDDATNEDEIFYDIRKGTYSTLSPITVTARKATDSDSQPYVVALYTEPASDTASNYTKSVISPGVETWNNSGRVSAAKNRDIVEISVAKKDVAYWEYSYDESSWRYLSLGTVDTSNNRSYVRVPVLRDIFVRPRYDTEGIKASSVVGIPAMSLPSLRSTKYPISATHGVVYSLSSKYNLSKLYSIKYKEYDSIFRGDLVIDNNDIFNVSTYGNDIKVSSRPIGEKIPYTVSIGKPDSPLKNCLKIRWALTYTDKDRSFSIDDSKNGVFLYEIPDTLLSEITYQKSVLSFKATTSLPNKWVRLTAITDKGEFVKDVKSVTTDSSNGIHSISAHLSFEGVPSNVYVEGLSIDCVYSDMSGDICGIEYSDISTFSVYRDSKSDSYIVLTPTKVVLSGNETITTSDFEISYFEKDEQGNYGEHKVTNEEKKAAVIQPPVDSAGNIDWATPGEKMIRVFYNGFSVEYSVYKKNEVIG